MKPWKSYPWARSWTKTSSLQWGHGDEAVEEAIPFAWPRNAVTLQWGHGDEAVEES